jgi:hypothetical protein
LVCVAGEATGTETWFTSALWPLVAFGPVGTDWLYPSSEMAPLAVCVTGWLFAGATCCVLGARLGTVPAELSARAVATPAASTSRSVAAKMVRQRFISFGSPLS